MSAPLKRNYISELDQFLQNFDQNNVKKSASQQKEIIKHKRIMQLRDQAKEKACCVTPPEKPIWEAF